MKFLSIIFLFLSHAAFAQIDNLNSHADFKNGQTAYLFGDQVKFRAEPSTDAETLATLAIGSAVTIIEKTDQTMFYNGANSPWYKVKQDEKTGYILGGLLALDKKEKGAIACVVALQQVGEYDQKMLCRLILSNGTYQELSLPFNTVSYQLKIYGNKGLSNIKNIIVIDYIAEACGVNGGESYCYFDGTHFKKLYDTDEISEAGLFYFSESLTFPEDEGGIANTIIYKKEKSEMIDGDNFHEETQITTKHLKWENGQFTPNIED